MAIDFEQDTQIELTDESIKQISALAYKQAKIEKELADLGDLVSDASKRLKKVAEEDLPLAMQEAGMKEFVLATGEKITIKEDIAPSIPSAKRLAAYTWLREHGHGSLIKNIVSVQFGIGEDEAAKQLIDTLAKSELKPTQKESVHPGTLKSFIKEQMADPETEELPDDLFTVFDIKKAIVKLS